MTPESSDREPWDALTWFLVACMFISSVGGSILMLLQKGGVL